MSNKFFKRRPLPPVSGEVVKDRHSERLFGRTESQTLVAKRVLAEIDREISFLDRIRRAFRLV